QGKARTVTLPDHATNGAVALDAAGRAVVAALRAHGNGLELVLSREEGKAFVTLATLKDPCAGQTKHLALTGFALGADGRLAIGLAQGGVPAYAFTRSWLIQGMLRDGAVTRDLQLTHHFSLLDGRGKPLDRFRAHLELAGRHGYPAKGCVPLFTALELAADDIVISGGHTLDPFLRVYDRLGGLRASWPRRGVGGQHLAVLPGANTPRLFAANPAASRVDELALDGRLIGSLGAPLAYRLRDVAALAADAGGVYVATRGEEGGRLLRFTAAGALAWARPLAPPAGMEKAMPYLASLGNERVFLGWRQPDADGVGMVEVVLEDGARGVPLWREAWTGAAASTAALNPTPLVAGRNGRLYVQRETKEGARVQAFSPAGALMQTFPAAVGGVSAALTDSTLAWVHPDEHGLLLTQYSAQGAQTGWKRLRPQPTPLVVTTTDRPWAWEPASGTLLRMDNTLTIVEDLRVLAPNGARVTAAAVAGDRAGRLYFAADEQILAGEYRP
ncbi:MAG TPA: hypothetical protein PLZ36_17300, partial [Armatimonadota bacterium]|nr:hypothetical protein [Armatimonadota bacterium]